MYVPCADGFTILRYDFRGHAPDSVNGTPNMTVLDFCTRVDGTLLSLVREHHHNILAKIILNTAYR